MQPLEFLAAVLPSVGHYCAVELTTKKREHKWVRTKEELLAEVEAFDASNKDAYFALASFAEVGDRTVENAQYLRALVLDIDCGEGKPYPTQKQGAMALHNFLADTKLPVPIQVNSGYGIHVYWPLDRDVPVAEWRVAGERLKRLAARHRLQIDSVIGANAAQVLRVPGTHNYKRGAVKQVRVVFGTAQTCSFDDIAEMLAREVNGHDVLAKPEVALEGKRLDGNGLTLLQNFEHSFGNLWTKTLNGSGCGQLEWYMRNANDQATEPVWRALIGVAKFCNDGEKALKKLTALHPRPDSEVRSKWAAKEEGPWTCDKFDQINPGVCDKCSHRGRIKTPLLLGRTLLVDDEPKEVTLPTPVAALNAAPQIMLRPDPPPTFYYGQHGGIYTEVPDKDNKGNVLQVCVLDYFLYTRQSLMDHETGEVLIEWVAEMPTGTKTFVVPLKDLAEKGSALKAMMAHGILPMFKAQTQMHNYVYSAARKEATHNGSKIAPERYGWQDDGSFVLNRVRYMSDGSVTSVPMGKLQNLDSITHATGSLDEWKSVVAMYMQKQHTNVLLGMTVALGAPLMRYSGLNFLLVCLSSPQSGTHKTAALYLAASVYGQPKQYAVHSETSAGTLQVRLASLGSLPLMQDESTLKVDQEGWLENLLMSATGGKDKERQQQRGGVELRQRSGWASLGLFTSNQSFAESLQSRNIKRNAELLRMLEIPMNDAPHYTPTELHKLTLLQSNYGHAGQLYVHWLVQNQDVAKARVKYWSDLLFKVANTEERFWVYGLACMLAGAEMFGKGYANIMNLPLQALATRAMQVLVEARAGTTGNVATAEDVFGKYMEQNYSKMLVVTKDPSDPSHSIRLAMGMNPAKVNQPRADLAGRIERGVVPGMVHIYIPKEKWLAHCRSCGYPAKTFAMQSGYKVRERRKELWADTDHNVGTRICTVIEMPETQWQQNLLSATTDSAPATSSSQPSTPTPQRPTSQPVQASASSTAR